MKLFKQPLFIIGFSFIVILLISSFMYSCFWTDHVKQLSVLYTKKGNLVGAAPFPPSKVFPFGTDRYGNQVFFTLLDGAKYTILFSLAIGVLRTFIGLGMGLVTAVTPFKIKSPSAAFQAIQTVPISLVLYFILQPVIFDNDRYVYFKQIIGYSGAYSHYPPLTSWDIILFETILLTVVSLPMTTKLFADETRLLLKEEYVKCSRTLGAGKWRQLTKHVLPHLWSKVWVVLIQQINLALLIIIQLGVLQMYFGGTYVKVFKMEVDIWPKTNEWSGIIGFQLDNLGATPWLVLSPLFFFFLLILSYNLILEGINRADENSSFRNRILEKTTHSLKKSVPSLKRTDFELTKTFDSSSN